MGRLERHTPTSTGPFHREMLSPSAIWTSHQGRNPRNLRCKPEGHWRSRLPSFVQHQGRRVHISRVWQAKVAPINPTSIPQLELCGAVLAVRAVDRITKEIDMEISQTLFYMDSTVVLCYICNESRRFHIYVSRRVETIRKSSSPNRERHIFLCVPQEVWTPEPA